MNRIHTLAAVVMGSTLALAGCGGDGDSNSNDNPDVALTSITADNAPRVSAVVYQAASALFDVASASDSLPPGVGISPTQARSGSKLGLASFAAAQLKAVARRSTATATRAVRAVDEQTYPCSGGGSFTALLDDADGNGVESVGDSLRLSFASCVEDGITSNGVLSWRLTLLSDESVGAKVSFGDFVLNDGTDTIGANGGFDLTVTTNPGVSELYQIAGDSLVSTLNGDRHTISGFTGSASTDLATRASTYSFSGRVSDSSQNVAVDAQTVTPFVAQSADDFPASGSLRSIGAGSSQALLEAVSATLVNISADPEGDGSFLPPVQMSWTALESMTD
jgi:hypothetical protein